MQPDHLSLAKGGIFIFDKSHQTGGTKVKQALDCDLIILQLGISTELYGEWKMNRLNQEKASRPRDDAEADAESPPPSEDEE
ncbi:hypothetical protein [Paenibacillus sp. UNCCL117]|uniref:hypothetical protein n=1 Tax=Paenibacillus sp. UNCCL117 TaxID=1502764 RepID=UPI0015A64E8B|nr:hypothetical protein [Paenibacillus sp. UNCCL117]